MDINLWGAFAAASLAMALVPGPGVATIVGIAVSSGRMTSLASVGGMAVGNMIAMTLSLSGVGALLAASAFAFAVLKWAGALYLIGLGLFAIARSRKAKSFATPRVPVSPKTAFLSTLAVGTFHPKAIIFFVAFAPQFISTGAAYGMQAAVLVATFTVIAASTDPLYAMAATRASTMVTSQQTRARTQRIGGGIMVTAGAAMALSRR